MIMSITNLFIPRTVQTYRCSISHNNKKEHKNVEICKMLSLNFLLRKNCKEKLWKFYIFGKIKRSVYSLFFNKYLKYYLIVFYFKQMNTKPFYVFFVMIYYV